MGIELSQVSFSYHPYKRETKKKKNKYVLENINVKIQKENEFICIVGHTGCGKSTLMQLFNALLLPTKGEVNIFGNIITNKKHNNLRLARKQVGLVFQFPEYQLFEETVLKDVSFGPKNYKMDEPEEKAKEALKIIGLDDSFYERSPFCLSGGEKRKVAISGILASNPDVLILDEPTVGLDPFTKGELIKLLKEINKEKTVIIVTHDMNVLWNVATRVIVLDNKQIVYDGDKKTLFSDIDFVNKHSLDLPDVVSVLSNIKKDLKLDIDIYQDTIDKAFEELLRVTNE